MQNWHDITYLKSGTSQQKRMYNVLTHTKILELLQAYQPVVIGTIPIDIDMEFRGFVYNNQLNALSQYNHFIYFQRLTEMKQEIQKRILSFFEQKVKDKLKEYEGYIVDFAICGQQLDTILIIELNPFMDSTDPGLFSWKNEREKLQNGPFEYRIRDQKPKEQIAIEYKYRVLLGWEK